MGKRIIAIDDEEPVRKSFVLALKGSNISVDTATSGEEGLEKIKSIDYNLIFLDLKMPGMNGIETLREIRKRNRKVLVYIVTAFVKEFFHDLKALREENIEFEVMQKPLNLYQIEEITKALLP